MTQEWLGVIIAFAGAFGYALGAAIQQLDAVRLGASRALMRQTRWWIGGGISFTGACLHAVALVFAPLTIIQPISMTTLVYAVPLAAKFHGRKPRKAELLGSVAVSIGLAGLMLMIPIHESGTPTLGDGLALWFLGAVLFIVLVSQLVGRRVAGPFKALFFAVGAGVATGTVSTFVRIVGVGLHTDLANLVHWFTLVIPAMLIVATILLQKSYAVGYFGIAYAAAQVADPIASVLAGAGLLGEPLPSDPLLIAPALLCAALLIVGTVVLGRNAPDHAGAAAADETPPERVDTAV
ncbi:MAG TPA: DMT family transporter [Candidatus Stackebrandtia excrementipullorum]|nr:DMT family transporter [Candidatus Stackebrandtia excrementipullorum]